jgi:uncharacterized membrane protein
MAVVHFRTDTTSERALAELTADGSTVSEAIRRALVDAVRLRRRELMQTTAVATERLGDSLRCFSHQELEDINDSLCLVLGTGRDRGQAVKRVARPRHGAPECSDSLQPPREMVRPLTISVSP